MAYKNDYRGYLIDHHSPDRPFINFNRFDLCKFEQLVKSAHIDNMLVYCKDHYGLAYYRTKIGQRHPRLKTALVEDIRAILQKLKISFIAYYSVGFDEAMAAAHPAWTIRDDRGKTIKIQDVPGASRKWHWMCLQSDYLNYCCKMLAEIVRLLKPDTVFLDIIPHFPCYCATCRKAFHKRYGFPMPRGDQRARKWQALQEFQNDMVFKGISRMVKAVKQVNPSVAVTLNGGPMEYSHKVLGLTDYLFAEPWAGNFLSAAFARDTGQSPVIGPGRVSMVFDPNKTPVYTVEQSAILAQNCRVFMYSNSMYPDGHLDALEFKNVGTAYREIEQFQSYCRNRSPIRCVGILYSESSRIFDPENRHRKSLQGALQLAAYAKYPFAVIPEWKWALNELTPYPCLVAPEVTCLSDSQAAVLDKYVKAGGILVSTGSFGLCNEKGTQRGNFALAEVLGCDFVKTENQYHDNLWGSYLECRPHPAWDSIPKTMLAVSPPFQRVCAVNGQALAWHRLPCVALTDKQWVNWWPPPPANEPSDLPAIHLNQPGQGQSCYFSFDFTGLPVTPSQYGHPFRWPYMFFRALLEHLLPRPFIRINTPTPHGLGATFYQKGNNLIIHELNLTITPQMGDVSPISGGTIQLQGPALKVKSAQMVYPRRAKLKALSFKDGVEINAPAVSIHNVILIQL